MQWSDFSFYFAGDTGYSSDFKQTVKKLGKPNLAAIPIGAYEPRNFMKSAHINPEEAVKVFNDLGAKMSPNGRPKGPQNSQISEVFRDPAPEAHWEAKWSQNVTKYI